MKKSSAVLAELEERGLMMDEAKKELLLREVAAGKLTSLQQKELDHRIESVEQKLGAVTAEVRHFSRMQRALIVMRVAVLVLIILIKIK